jgi:cytochrome b6-f complex iron-sulfur subunit
LYPSNIDSSNKWLNNSKKTLSIMKNEQISRGQFLKDLGLGGAALMAFYCLGGVSACKSSSDPTPSTTTTGTTTGTTTTGIDFTLDLTSADYKGLKTAGGFVYKDDIIIANANGTYVALSKVCTHQGTTVSYRSASNDMYCSNHGSQFNVDGSVKTGPAASGLKVYKTTLSTDGNKLQITA